MSDYLPQTKWFDTELMQKRGTAIFGNRGSGKSNLVKLLIRRLLEQGVTVKVFDPSQTHLEESDIKYYQVVNNLTDICKVYNDSYTNMIFDTSRLYPQHQKIFIAWIMNRDFQDATENKRVNWLCHVIEECQLILNSTVLRSEQGQECLRWVTVGRNFNLTYILASQRPSMVSTTAISLTGARYFGQLDEPNDLSKLKKFIRDKQIITKVPELNVGEFVVKLSEPQIVKMPLFKPYETPQQFNKPKPQPKGLFSKLMDKWNNWK